jgi:hypothetical protein
MAALSTASGKTPEYSRKHLVIFPAPIYPVNTQDCGYPLAREPGFAIRISGSDEYILRKIAQREF